MSLYEYSISRYNAVLADLSDGDFKIKRHVGWYVLYNGTKMLADGDIDYIKKRAYGIIKERGEEFYLDD